MANSKVAFRYAKSLYAIAKDSGVQEQVLSDFTTFLQTCKSSRELRSLIHSPIILGSKKLEVLSRIFFPNFQEVSSKFITLVINKGRESDLMDIAEAYIKEDKRFKGIVDAQIVSAAPLTDELKSLLLKRAEEMAGSRVDLTEKIDSSLIGGFVLKVNDLQYDASVKSKMERIGSQLLDHSYIPKIDLI